MKKNRIVTIALVNLFVPLSVCADESSNSTAGNFFENMPNIIEDVDITGPFKGGLPDIEIGDIEIGDVTVTDVIGDIIKVENTSVDQHCTDNASCSINIGTGALNAVGDMYPWSVAGLMPLEFGFITEKKYIRNPFKTTRQLYFTYQINNNTYEGLLLLLPYDKTIPGAPTIVNRDIENELQKNANVKSAVKLLLRAQGETLWQETINIVSTSRLTDIISNNMLSVLEIDENGLPSVMVQGVRHKGKVIPVLELKVPVSLLPIQPIPAVLPTRRTMR